MSSISVLILCGMCALALMAFACYGWGCLTRHATALPKGTWPATTALGLATIILCGGFLNVLRLARPAAFAVIVFAGLLLVSRELWRDSRARPWLVALRDLSGPRWAWWIATILIVGFACATQLMPSFYNSGDDLKEYFGHAVRMVETGTLYGSPLNASGAETLGAQAFLQGFVISFAPLRFINGFDAVFCLFLCMALAGGVAIARPAASVPALLATLGAVAIDPQYVNISSLYSTAVVASALTLLAADEREGEAQSDLSWRRAAAPALLYAAGAALKSTNVVFLGVQFALSAGCSLLAARRWQESAATYGRMAVLACIFLSPWLLLYAPYYISALMHPVGPPLTAVPEVHERHLLASLISARMTFYGAAELAYTCLAIGLLACALTAANRARQSPHDRYRLLQLAAATGAAAATYFFWVLYAPHLQELSATRRYPIPVLIGCASVALPLWTLAFKNAKTYAYVTAAAIGCLFVLPLRDRLGTLVHQRSQLAYLQRWNAATRNGLQQFTGRALGSGLPAKVRGIQSLVPPGERILVWTAAPFLLDYHRNEIIDVNEAGLNQAWGHVAPVRYVLWQRAGYGADRAEEFRSDIPFGRRSGRFAARALDVLAWLDEAAHNGRTIWDEEGITLIETTNAGRSPPD